MIMVYIIPNQTEKGNRIFVFFLSFLGGFSAQKKEEKVGREALFELMETPHLIFCSCRCILFERIDAQFAVSVVVNKSRKRMW